MPGGGLTPGADIPGGGAADVSEMGAVAFDE